MESSTSPKFDPTKPIDFTIVAGKTALITGGASGIGLGIATALAGHGAHVALLDINEEQGREAEMALTEKGLKAKFIQTDVTSWEIQHEAFKEVKSWSETGRVDIVVASAGVVSPNIKHIWLPLEGEEMPAEPTKPPTQSILTNLLGSYYTAHLALSTFTRQTPSPTANPSQLLLIASIAAYHGQDFNPDYCASKHGVRGLFKGIRYTSSHFSNFQANLLAPTFISTPMVKPFEEMLTWRGARVGRVGDVVDAALRCVADGEVTGRAVGVVRGEEGEGGKGFGVGNFDLEDEGRGGSCGRVLEGKWREGVFGEMHGNAR